MGKWEEMGRNKAKTDSAVRETGKSRRTHRKETSRAESRLQRKGPGRLRGKSSGLQSPMPEARREDQRE